VIWETSVIQYLNFFVTPPITYVIAASYHYPSTYSIAALSRSQAVETTVF